MRKITRYTYGLILLATVFVSGVTAQDTFYSIYSFSNFIPDVTINSQSEDLQRSLFPRQYPDRSVRTDIRWVRQNDSLLNEFWTIQGDTILHIIRELSGIEWIETKFDIYLVRFYPTFGNSEPTIIPIGGIDDKLLIEAPIDGNRQKFNLIYQLAKRNLGQLNRPQDEYQLSLSYHPLLRPSAYRRDVMAMLLAVNTAYSVMGIDSTYDAINSAFWKNNFSGMEIFEKYFEKSWIITPERTLTNWLRDEPTNSQLVYLTRLPKKIADNFDTPPRFFIENLPLKGKLGVSTRLNDAGQLLVDKIDLYRFGYAAGLREGDIIRRVDNKVVRNQKALIEAIMETFEKGGAIIEIRREGRIEELLLEPFLEIEYPDDFYQTDSLPFDTLPPHEQDY